jgi:HNH endonuclease
MTTLRQRFAANVDRSGGHHLWTGSKKADGTGKMKVDSKAVTAQRVAWELTHGQLPPGVEVRACPEDRACVRIEHLSLRRPPSGRRGTPTRSRSRGGGSKVEVRPGVWKLSVSAGCARSASRITTR